MARAGKSADVANRVRAICLALPQATERVSHGAPAFFVGKQFVALWPEATTTTTLRTCGARHRPRLAAQVAPNG